VSGGADGKNKRGASLRFSQGCACGGRLRGVKKKKNRGVLDGKEFMFPFAVANHLRNWLDASFKPKKPGMLAANTGLYQKF